MKKSLLEKSSDILLIYSLMYVMVAIPRTHYICTKYNAYYSNMAIALHRCALLCLVAVVYALIVFRKKIRFSRYEAVFVVMILLQLISCHFALSEKTAIWGASGRNEGLVTLLCYYMLFYTARFVADEKLRGLVVKFFLFIMTLHALYGLGQFFELTWLPFIHDYYHYAISGVAGNPNFMGSLMVMACGSAAGLLIYSKSNKARVVYAILLAIFSVTLIFTKTMSAYIGLIMIVATIVIIRLMYVYRTKGKKTAFTLLAVLIIGGLLGLFVLDKLTYGVITDEIMLQLQNGINLETFASGRLFLWLNIFRMLPQYLMFGVGIDGLEQPYFDRYGLLLGAYVDKAHNELIQILITMGLPVLICYIVFYVFVAKDIRNRIKSQRNKALDMALLFAFIGYMTQAMFNISVIDVAPYFWILLGLSATPVVKE